MLAPLLIAVAALAAAAPAPPPTLLAAGDISSCTSSGDEQTAALLDRLPGRIAALGDLLYDGTYDECYAWGRVKARTRPALGNHEYYLDGGSGYFAYWGSGLGGDPAHGWYSYDLGRWHVVVLNSNCSIVGCRRGSVQDRWLRADLRAHRRFCTLAYWHHPRFSSGPHGDDGALEPLWTALYAAGADVVLTGHDHDYERFAPQTADGRLDRRGGIREFVVGTGGRSLYDFRTPPAANSEARAAVLGVLRLTLLPRSYRWQFVPADGTPVPDVGSSRCH